MYSSRPPPPPRIAAPEPAFASGQPGPQHELFPEPINHVWPTGLPHGKQWRGQEFPDFRISDYFAARNSEFSQETGRNALLSGNRVLAHYQSLANALYAAQDHMVKQTDALSKNGPILRHGDFSADQFFQNTMTQGIAPHFRGETPSLPARSGFPYSEEEVPDIPPTPRRFWKTLRMVGFSRLGDQR